jgi:predicted ATPase
MITRFKIQNFKSLKNIDLSLSNLNVLTGMNSMGKSSVIQSLYLIRQAFLNDRFFEYFKINQPDMPLGKTNDILYQYSTEDIIRFSIDFKYDVVLPLYLEYEFQIDKDYLKLKNLSGVKTFVNNATLDNIAIFNNKFQYLNSNLIGPKYLHERDDYIVNIMGNIGIHGQYTIQFLSVNGKRMKVPPVLIHKKSTSEFLKANVEAWLSEVSPGIRINPLSIPGDTGYMVNFQFESGRELTSYNNPFNIGFGTNYVIPIITALLTAEEGKLIIIESPEVYLHPKGQSKIGELAALAASTGAQIIIETHSDHVINGIRVATKQKKILPANIKMYYFERNHDDKERYSYINEMKIDSDGRLDFWPEGFMDEWDKNLMELI